MDDDGEDKKEGRLDPASKDYINRIKKAADDSSL